MKTIVSIIAVIAAGALAVHYMPWSKDYVEQTVSAANRDLGEKISNDFLVEKAAAEIGDFKSRATEQLSGIIEGKSKLVEKQADLERQIISLNNKENALRIAGDWLKSHKPGDVFVNNAGKSFSYKEVDNGAQLTLEAAKANRASLAALRESCDVLSTAVSEAEASYDKNLQTIQRAEGKLEADKVQLSAWKMVQETKNIAQGLDVSTLGSGMAMKEIQKRLNDISAERSQANKLESGPKSAESIVAAEPETDTAQQIGEYFNPRKVAQPVAGEAKPAPAAGEKAPVSDSGAKLPAAEIIGPVSSTAVPVVQ